MRKLNFFEDYSNSDYDLCVISNCGAGTIEDEENCEDIFDRIGDDIHEEKEDERKNRLSYDFVNDTEEEVFVSNEQGLTTCRFITDSQVHFLRFCSFLSKFDFEKMKVCDPHHYMVEVYKLNDESAEFIRDNFLALKNFVPLQSQGEVA
ncbi:MAG: hypothetical protein J5629_09625 [Muribaculaceae bacterium]|nr:hypothetical protein [Muribaculaceae bacterium]